MKKQKEKEEDLKKPKSQEIKIRYGQDKMIFALGENEFYLDKETALGLFGNGARFKFDKLAGGQFEDFSDLNNLDFICRFEVVFNHFGNLSETSKFLKMDGARLKRWMSQDERFKRDKLTELLIETEALKERYTREFFGEEKKEEIKSFNPDMKMVGRIVNLVMKKYGPRAIAEELRVDYNPFIMWFTKGESQKVIQNKIRNK